MRSTFEELGGTYRQEGDYLLPNVEVPESPAIGIWGQRRHKFRFRKKVFGLEEPTQALHNFATISYPFISNPTYHFSQCTRLASRISFSFAILPHTDAVHDILN